MVMKAGDIVKALNSLEMKGGEHVIPESLRVAIIDAMAPKKPVKRSSGAKKLSEDGTPAWKGKTPE